MPFLRNAGRQGLRLPVRADRHPRRLLPQRALHAVQAVARRCHPAVPAGLGAYPGQPRVAGTSVPSKTAFPSSWSEKRVRHEVLETVAAPDLVRSMKDGNREDRYRMVGEEIIRVWLQKKRNTRGRYMINTAFPTVGEEKEMA